MYAEDMYGAHCTYKVCAESVYFKWESALQVDSKWGHAKLFHRQPNLKFWPRWQAKK